MATRGQPPGDGGIRELDDLRQQLRSLGYLDAGVDRFVLGAARSARGHLVIAWLSSLRIGALAAILLGPAASIGIAARMPGLITGPRDGFIVAAYVGLVFGTAVCALAFLAIALVSRVARSTAGERGDRRVLARAAGAAVTIACLGYLTLWWDGSTFSGDGRSGLWTIVALLFAVAISLLLGHAVIVTALAVTLARHGTGGALRRVPAASRPTMAAAATLMFCGAILLFHFTARSGPPAAAAPALTVVPSGLRVRVIAIDGFDPAVAARLGESGRIPSLASALDGARALVQTEDTRDPARTWTTIATGQPADVHAVRGLETRRVIGLQGTLATGDRTTLWRTLGAATDLVRLTRPSIASGDERRAQTLWEVASTTGLRTAVVNWWATWPAPADAGIVVSDRAPLRLERGGALDAEISPPELYEMLRSQWADLRKEAAARAEEIAAAPEAAGLLRRAAELDALQLAISRKVAAGDVDLACTYLPGLDVAQHGLLAIPEGSAPSPSAVASRLMALENYYVFLDRLLESAIRPADGELIVIVTSPGRVQASASGLIVVRGSAANPRVRDAVARPTDLAPTVLYALGVPVSRELPGRVLIELFSADFARRYPVREVTTYGRPSARAAPRSGTPLDQEMIDRLRSLGYVR